MYTTYKSAIIQTKAHNLLRLHVVKALETFNISPSEWVIVGHLNSSVGLRFVDIAKILSVEPPHVTVLIDQLEEKKLVKRADDPKDRRAKLIILTSKGKDLFPSVETKLQKVTSELLKGVSNKNLTIYFDVLETIIKNSEIILEGGEK